MRLSFCILLIIYCPVMFPSLEHVEEYCDMFLRTFVEKKNKMNVCAYLQYLSLNVSVFPSFVDVHLAPLYAQLKQICIPRIHLLFHSGGLFIKRRTICKTR